MGSYNKREKPIDQIVELFYGNQVAKIRNRNKAKNYALQNKVMARYPLLAMMNRYYHNEDIIPDIIDMINGKYARISKSAGQSNVTSV